MNIPTYQRKDYSYLQNAFTGLQQGMGALQQGIARTQEIGQREREMEREQEFFDNLKITNSEADVVREQKINEYASKVWEAMGLPDTPEGYERARSIAAQKYYPSTAQEKKEGTAAKRFFEQEKTDETELTRMRMSNWSGKATKGETYKMPPRKEIQEPAGNVGIEDRGRVRTNLSSFPQSPQEASMSAEQELLKQKRYLPETLTHKLSDQELWDLGVELGITNEPRFKAAMEKRGRDAAAAAAGPDLTQEKVATAGFQQPVQPSTEMIGFMPSEQENKKLKVEELKAKKQTGKGTGGDEVKLKDLLEYGRKLQDSQRQISTAITSTADKIRNPMKRNVGDTEESLNTELKTLQKQREDLQPLIKANENDIEYKRKQLKFPEAPKAEPVTGPSEDAQKVAADILNSMKVEKPKGYAVVSRFGKPTYSKGKGPKTKYFTEEFNRNQAKQVARYAKSVGVDLPVDKIAVTLKNRSLEDVIDAIIQRSKGK